ncbi:unnamed protein product, partial [Pylaiella littoralis]
IYLDSSTIFGGNNKIRKLCLIPEHAPESGVCLSAYAGVFPLVDFLLFYFWR